MKLDPKFKTPYLDNYELLDVGGGEKLGMQRRHGQPDAPGDPGAHPVRKAVIGVVAVVLLAAAGILVYGLGRIEDPTLLGQVDPATYIGLGLR